MFLYHKNCGEIMTMILQILENVYLLKSAPYLLLYLIETQTRYILFKKNVCHIKLIRNSIFAVKGANFEAETAGILLLYQQECKPLILTYL